ncbi:hypothetical protein MSAN_00683800 [Mycena sanguinolenta]|uniref:CID domain-containing protein n=1 Tax=Mycena sanguinolenta TaxID=230812 RepID=A0A8H6Z0Q3_9AGAR|nr:hypothetical protein MSAN_00683800 [Mycena sanguinolenta]
MAQLSEFEKALKEVVLAKRLSASKMNNLTEIALKSMQDDTQLVSILYRTHKSLQPAAKVSSLYVFDALARAARSQVVKQGLTGDINSRKGNSATFLLKIEGVLEGLFQDMISVSTPEAKNSPNFPRIIPQEKTKKVLDIWSKGSTFPAAILVRLKDVVNETEKDKVKVPTDPRSAAAVVTPPVVVPTPAPPPVPVLDPQATLLALLTQAANNAAQQSAPGQTVTNTNGGVTNSSQQLAVLQQLALTANLGNIGQQSPPNPPNFPASSQSPPPQRDEHYGAGQSSGRRDLRYDRGKDQERGRNYDDRNDFHGGFGGRGRGNGRGWDDRDRYKDVDRSPRRSRRSRSRSPPPRYPGRRERDVRPYSPPSRPSLASLPSKRDTRAAPEPGKDEFGRDIRPASPSPEPSAANNGIPAQPPPPAASSAAAAPAVVRTEEPVEPPPAAALTSNHDQMSLTPSVDANTSSRAPDAAVVVPNEVPSQQQGMENFSLATFDFTAPSSWEALGKMWQVTHGVLPSTEQLMAFVMSGGVMTGPAAGVPNQQQLSQTEWTGGHAWGGGSAGMQPGRGIRGRGGFSRGRGRAYGGGFARDGQDRWHSDMGQTDAIVLGGGDTDAMEVEGADVPGKGGGGGGRMQRVGEKWVFVRDPITANES